MLDYAEDVDPRFSDRPANRSGGKSDFADDNKSTLVSGKKRPRIAFTGEEWGFGYKAAEKFIRNARARGTVPDAGWSVGGGRVEDEFDEASSNSGFDYNYEITQPLRTKEQALMAVRQDTADFALIPFYNPYAGYDYESLRAVASLFTCCGVQQIEATDTMCLAVHESQLYDIIQSAHPGTGFSALQRRFRKSWGTIDSGSGNEPGADYQAEMPRAGLPIDMADQKLIRDRIDVVYAGPEAARRCKSKLDGLRVIGIDVQEISQMVEPHRELARLARATTNTSRQTNTHYDPATGDTRFHSTLSAESQSGKLFGMVLPYEVAMRSSDYVIVDHDFDDAPPNKTRFMVVEQNFDHTLFENAYRTTDARTSYWGRRLHAIARKTWSFGAGMAGLMQFAGFTLGTVAVLMLIFGGYGLLSGVAAPFANVPASLSWLASLSSAGAVGIGAIAGAIAWVLLSVKSAGQRGVRVMFFMRRDGDAASLGDVENYLRNFGIRHSVVRVDEDSESAAPAGLVLDVEFDAQDFSYGPFAMFSRRLRGSVVNGALKKTFQRWKNRGVRVLAAMPFATDPEQQDQYGMPPLAQLPRHRPRRWWNEALVAWLGDFSYTMFIRFAYFVAPVLIIAFLLWYFLLKQ